MGAAHEPDGLIARARAIADDPRPAIALLNEIDDGCTDELTKTELATAAGRTAALLRAWTELSIPRSALAASERTRREY